LDHCVRGTRTARSRCDVELRALVTDTALTVSANVVVGGASSAGAQCVVPDFVSGARRVGASQVLALKVLVCSRAPDLIRTFVARVATACHALATGSRFFMG